MQVMVAQTAPAVRVAIGEEAGLAPGSITTGQMVAGLKRLGFDYVFDTGRIAKQMLKDAKYNFEHF
jgi:NADH-quinone oxidoreductase subunit G